jgi:hypothetical protein
MKRRFLPVLLLTAASVTLQAQDSTGAPAPPTKAQRTPKTEKQDDAKPSSEQNTCKEWESRAIVGYHQAGAAQADHTQNFFFDFFIMRALSKDPLWGSVPDCHNQLKGQDGKEKSSEEPKGAGRWNLWGDVRIASTPQQVTTAVATFAADFATQVGNLPVNKLAQSADFQSGLEYRLHTWNRQTSTRMLGVVAGFGAMGTFEAPSKQVTIYQVPDPGSSQYARFAAEYPTAVKYKYVGFVPPDRDRFYRQYGAGFRLTSFSKGQPLAPPSMYTFTVGQDEAITAGVLHSLVGRFDVFYPLPVSSTGDYKCIYLFGTANLRLSRAKNVDPFVLNNPNIDPSTGKPVATPIQPYDPNVALVTVGSTRDTYRIGVGIDLVNLIQSISNSKQQKNQKKQQGGGGATPPAQQKPAAGPNS